MKRQPSQALRSSPWRTRFAFLLSLSMLGACLPQSEPVYHHRARLPDDRFVDITLIGETHAVADQVTTEVIDELKTTYQLWGLPDAPPLARTNRLLPTGKRFSVAPSIMPLIQLGKRFHAQSDGLLDPAAGILDTLWGMRQPRNSSCRPTPTAALIEATRKRAPGMDDIEIHGIQICSRSPFARLDFSLFQTGYNVDLAVQHLRERGIDNALVSIGGNLRAIGSRRGTPWRIALRNPGGGGVLGSVDVAGDEAVFTAGDYLPSKRCAGVDRQHIIDPRTGRPVSATHSVTVIHPSATVADAAANALFIAGPKDWKPIAKKLGVDQVLLIDRHGRIQMTEKMRKRTTLIGEP